MAAVFESPVGWILDHRKWLQESFGSNVVFIAPELFQFRTAFRMDEEAKRVAEGRPQKKRRKMSDDAQEGGATLKQHEVPGFVRDLLASYSFPHSLQELNPSDVLDNNRAARLKAKIVLEHPLAYTMTNLEFHGMNSSLSSTWYELEKSHKFLIPPKSRWFNNDVFLKMKDSTFLKSILADGLFDLVVMDPPWPNKHVARCQKRNEGYTTVKASQLALTPLSSLLDKNGVLALWATPALKDTAIDLVQGAWGFKVITTWMWWKVTTSGAALTQPPRKPPIEWLILASVTDDCPAVQAMRQKRGFVSVPSAIHSQKPPLRDILTPLLRRPGEGHPHCLEIFARSLIPGWTSIGNQCLLLQQDSLFEAN